MKMKPKNVKVSGFPKPAPHTIRCGMAANFSSRVLSG